MCTMTAEPLTIDGALVIGNVVWYYIHFTSPDEVITCLPCTSLIIPTSQKIKNELSDKIMIQKKVKMKKTEKLG